MNKYITLILAMGLAACKADTIVKEYTIVAEDTGHDHELEDHGHDHDHELEDHDHDHDHEVPEHDHPEYEPPEPEPEPEFCDLAVDCAGYFYVQDNFEAEEVRQCKTITGYLSIELYSSVEEPVIDLDFPCLTEVTDGINIYGGGVRTLEFPVLKKTPYVYMSGQRMESVPAFESLEEVENIQIAYFDKASTISGFNKVKNLDYLYIGNMYDFYTTGGDYTVPGLETIDGFTSLETVNDFYLVNTSVSNIEGFDALTESANYLRIYNNYNLCATDAQELADRMSVDSASEYVYSNNGSCD